MIAPALTAGRWRAALAVMAASGFAGLGYQIVWTQQCALWLGHEAAAVLAVVTAFFGGLAVGGFLFGPRIERSRRPARWYAGCELLIALWSLLLALAMAPFSDALLALTGAQPSPLWQWTVAFAGSFLLLLPATAAMGATLPAMARVAAGWQRERRAIAPLYAANTFGAVIGVLAIAFLLMPTLGLLRTAGVCTALNLLCALAALRWLPASVEAATTAAVPTKPIGDRLRVRLFATGLLGIGYEVLVVRVLSEVAEDTVYTFALLLAVYLVGSAAGAAGYARWSGRVRDSERMSERLLSALAGACLLGIASLWTAGAIHALALQVFGSSMAAALAAEALLALLAFGLPTIVMGALFSHLAAQLQAGGASFGRALGLNTLGACAAAPLFGVLALPLLGAKGALLLIVAGYLLLAWRRWRGPLLWTPTLALVAMALFAPPLAHVELPDGGRVVRYQEGVMAAVSVVEDGDGVRRLRINNRQQEGSSATRRVDGRQALLPLLLHPAPQRLLFLGLGTGITASTAAADPALQVTAVELLPEVIAASAEFIAPGEPGPRMLAADARRYVRASGERYDLVIADNFHPARSGSGSLYTVEHYAAVRERLADGGRFCQWLPLHQLDLDSLRSIVQAFLRVYPDAQALLASNSLETPVLGLLGGREPLRFELAAVEARLAAATAPSPARYGIEDAHALLGSFVAGPAALRDFAGTAAANSDDRPVVAYRAPRLLYAPDSRPRDRLIALLAALSIAPDQVLAAGSDAAQARRLAAYWQARDRFIVLGRDVRPSGDVDALLARIGGPLLGLLRASPDFRPAYDPLLQMATALAASDAPQAAALLDTLIALQPARPEAAAARRALASPRP